MDFEGILIHSVFFDERRFWGGSLGTDLAVGIYRAHRVAEGFWARRARISVDILELGCFPSWQGGKWFWAYFFVCCNRTGLSSR